MTSSELIEALNKDTVVERDYIVFTNTADRIYLWFNLYDDCYNDGNFIGTFIMKRIEIDYEDADIEFKNKEFKAYKEYKIDDDTWESIDYGTFIVTDVQESDTKDTIKVTAYDYALKFAIPYVSNLDYASGEITLEDVLEECCIQANVSLATTDFTNSDFIVDSNQFEERQVGNVISAIAGISCNFAKIVQDELYLVFFNETDTVIEKKDYENFDDKRDTRPITIVSLGMNDVEGENVTRRWEEGITLYGENYLIINDNPFAYTEEKRFQLIDAIFNKAKGFGYSAMTLTNCLFPYLKCGDLVTIKNQDGESVSSIVLRRSFEKTNIKLEAPSIIKATVSYQNVKDIYNIIKMTELKVDKDKQTIDALISQLNETNQNIASLNLAIDSINGSVKQIGGNNKQINSVGAGGTDDYEQNDTGTILSITTESLRTSTQSGRIISIYGNKWFKFKSESLVIGDIYTISFKYSNEEFNNCLIKLLNNNEIEIVNTAEEKTLENVEYTFVANTEFIELYVSTGSGNLSISDYYFQTGDIATTWQPAPRRSTKYKFKPLL